MTREITPGTSNNVSVSLSPTASTNLTEVVVTSAFGIKKSHKNYTLQLTSCKKRTTQYYSTNQHC